MSTYPMVSTIIPAYNSVEYIGEALESALRQNYENQEVIVINDGSTDGTGQILKSFGNRIRVINQTNAGSAVARSHGIRVARGKYLAFLDADDLWLPGKLVAQVSHLERNPEVGMVYSAWQEWYPEANGQFVAPAMDKINGDADALETQSSGWLYNALLLDCIIHTTTVVMRSNVAREVGDFDKALKRGQDYDYWLRVSRLTPIHKLRGVYSLYRVHPESITNRPHAVNYNHLVLQKTLDRWGRAGPDGTVTDQRDLNRVLSRIWFGFGYRHYEIGDPKLATSAFLQCIRYRPFWYGGWLNLARTYWKRWRSYTMPKAG